MKRLILLIAILLVLFSCTDNKRARSFGGKQTINLPKGERLVTATWKQDDLWFITEPMSADYIPTTKKFREDSSYGLWEGEVLFVESK